MLVARVDARRAHRQRLAHRLHGAEAAARALRGARAGRRRSRRRTPSACSRRSGARTPRSRRGTGTALRDARGRVHDLVAVHPAAPALDLVLRPERQLGRWCHCAFPSGVIVDTRSDASASLDGTIAGGIAARPRRGRLGFAAWRESSSGRSLVLAPDHDRRALRVPRRRRRCSSSSRRVALIPLAWLIGEATEHAAEHTGPGIGGFLNASFGNAPELIIALFAISSGLPDVVRGSLAGSVVSNILLVLGLAHARRAGRGALDRRSLAAPARARRLRGRCCSSSRRCPAFTATRSGTRSSSLTIPVAIVLLGLYVGGDVLEPAAPPRARTRREARRAGVEPAARARRARRGDGRDRADQRDPRPLARRASRTRSASREFFIAVVIVAIVGNAAEHGGAVVIAHRGNMRLASEIAISSSAQVALVRRSRRSRCSRSSSRPRCRSPSGRSSWSPWAEPPRSSAFVVARRRARAAGKGAPRRRLRRRVARLAALPRGRSLA